jgi:UDPglucose 6-dehydrogenase
MKIGIVGFGVVGKHVAKDVIQAGHQVLAYDKFKDGYNLQSLKNDINDYCDAVFICVGTPELPSGKADITAVIESVSWLTTPVIIIRSTVPPGTTESLISNSDIVFVPEFIGEGVNAPYNNMKQPPFLIIGGTKWAQESATQIFNHIYNSECEFIYTTASEAEVAKYAENYFLALKVTWANEMYDICKKLGVDYSSMMSAVTHDYRIGRSHTFVFDDKRGFEGRCLPKDTSSLLHDVGDEVAPLLAEMKRINARRKNG